MTPKRTDRAAVAKSKFSDYAAVAENFYSGADLAKEFEYWNAAGVLIVHAAIAYTDAVTIKIGAVKSRGEDHLSAVDLLRMVVALDDRGQKAVTQFLRILEHKNRVSYSGEIYVKDDIDKLWKHLERYRSWARIVLEI